MKLLASLFAATLVTGTAALAQPSTPAAGVTAPRTLTDVSTVKRKRVVRRVAVAPVYGPPVYSQWRGADPSWGPNTPLLREYQRRGVCVIDEGYGRFTFCTNR